MLIDELFEQTDKSVRQKDSDDKIPEHMKNDKEGTGSSVFTKDKSIFGRHNRLQLLVGLINESISRK